MGVLQQEKCGVELLQDQRTEPLIHRTGLKTVQMITYAKNVWRKI